MKKIINGRVYNTETATRIAEWANGLYRPDFGYCEEDLYKKRNGEYFVAGQGGANSSYAERVGSNTWGGGSGIRPITPQEALSWCEEKDVDADIIEEEFGISEEDEDSKRAATFHIDEAALRMLTAHAAKTGKSKSQIVREALAAHLSE